MSRDFFIVRGDTQVFNLHVKRGNSPVNISGATIWMTAKRHFADLDSAAIFQVSTTGGVDGVITIMDAGGGYAQAVVVPAATEGLEENATLYYDVQVVEAVTSRKSTGALGILRVAPDVTLA